MCAQRQNKPLTDNIGVYGPNGKIMFYANEKRAQWYLKRNLATYISNHNIQLLFEPGGPGVPVERLYHKPNMCVVCGSIELEKLTRHHIVPMMYRKNFPVNLKTHNDYDVQIICVKCHCDYEIKATDLKIELTKNLNVPLIESKLIKSVITWIKYRSKLPACREFEIFSNIIESGLDPFDEIKLKEFIIQNPWRPDTYYTEQVLSHWKNNLEDFILLWRNHFITNMSPQYMPHGWDINYIQKTDDRKLFSTA